jgi:hypothetical protein
MKTVAYALLGVALILFAIPLGLMLAPLIVGAILLWLGLRRADGALQAQAPGAAA